MHTVQQTIVTVNHKTLFLHHITHKTLSLLSQQKHAMQLLKEALLPNVVIIHLIRTLYRLYIHWHASLLLGRCHCTVEVHGVCESRPELGLSNQRIVMTPISYPFQIIFQYLIQWQWTSLNLLAIKLTYPKNKNGLRYDLGNRMLVGSIVMTKMHRNPVPQQLWK